MPQNHRYDSKAESSFHGRNPELIYNTYGKDFAGGHLFADKNGWAKTARLDFYDKKSKHYIEFKAAPLNAVESMRDSEELEHKNTCWIHRNKNLSRGFKGVKIREAQLKYGWNHSLYKQKIVGDWGCENNKPVAVVFGEGTKLTEEQQRQYNEADLNWMFEEEMHFILDPNYTEIVGDEHDKLRLWVQSVTSTFGDVVRQWSKEDE